MYTQKIIKIMLLFLLALMLSACEPTAHSKHLISERYVDNRDGTITDIRTNLTWMRCSLGQQWTGGACVGAAMEMPWSEAIKAAGSFSYAGFSNWRLPTVDELDSLIHCQAGRKLSARPGGLYVEDTDGRCHGDEYYEPKININAFPNTPADWFWSSSLNDNNSNFVWYVGFTHGIVGNSTKSGNSRVRLVHSGK